MSEIIGVFADCKTKLRCGYAFFPRLVSDKIKKIKINLNLIKMDFLDSDFYKNSLNVLRDLRKSKLIETKFPELKYLISGDQIYQNLWKIIDESKVIIIKIFVYNCK